MKNCNFEISTICFGGGDWWYHNRAHMDIHLTRRFAKKGPALFVNSIVMQKFNIKEGRNFFKRLIRKTKSIVTGLKKTEEGFWVYSPFTLPVHHIPLLRTFNQILLRFQIRCVSCLLGIRNPIVIVAIPSAAETAMKMKKRKLIYQRTDRFEESIGIDVKTIIELDKKLKKSADLTVFVSRSLYQEELSECKNPLFLDHGVDYDFFAQAEQDRSIPSDMIDIPHPVVGYFGAIHWHSVDIDLAEKVADLLPDISFVYVGSVSSGCSGLVNKKNVWMLGQKDYKQIPKYGKCFDVAILPWIKNQWTVAANPVKVKEYLALGKPFVSTSAVSEIQCYLGLTYVADTPEEFARCIEKALTENDSERIAARREKVKDESWESKVKLILNKLFGNGVINGES